MELSMQIDVTPTDYGFYDSTLCYRKSLAVSPNQKALCRIGTISARTDTLPHSSTKQIAALYLASRYGLMPSRID